MNWCLVEERSAGQGYTDKFVGFCPAEGGERSVEGVVKEGVVANY